MTAKARQAIGFAALLVLLAGGVAGPAAAETTTPLMFPLTPHEGALGPGRPAAEFSASILHAGVLWAELRPHDGLQADLELLDEDGASIASSRQPAGNLDAVRTFARGAGAFVVRVAAVGGTSGTFVLEVGARGAVATAERDLARPVLALLDTGVDPLVVPARKSSRGATGSIQVSSSGPTTTAHGTAVASAVLEGSGGAPPQLVVGKVLDALGTGRWANVAAAIDWATGEEGADVVVLSLGAQLVVTGEDREKVYGAIRRATDGGALVVVANGNSGRAPGELHPLSDAPDALAVGATDERGVVSPSSDFDPTLVAHGQTVCVKRPRGSPVPQPHPSCEGGGYQTGTSLAAGVAGGVAAFAVGNEARGRDGRSFCLLEGLRHAAVDNPTVPYAQEGHGRLDASRAPSARAGFLSCLESGPALPNGPKDLAYAASTAVKRAQHPG